MKLGIREPGLVRQDDWQAWLRNKHTLRPFAVVMTGSNEFDPYKD